eukprot:5549580-Prymnesium_polylepis.1
MRPEAAYRGESFMTTSQRPLNFALLERHALAEPADELTVAVATSHARDDGVLDGGSLDQLVRIHNAVATATTPSDGGAATYGDVCHRTYWAVPSSAAIAEPSAVPSSAASARRRDAVAEPSAVPGSAAIAQRRDAGAATATPRCAFESLFRALYPHAFPSASGIALDGGRADGGDGLWATPPLASLARGGGPAMQPQDNGAPLV